MRKATLWRLAITIALAFAVAIAIFAIWIIPGSINGRIRSLVPGSRARIDRWWVTTSQGGVNGLTWFHDFHADAPEWARARRVETDLGLSDLFGGRTTPRRITLIEPVVTIRLDQNGRLLIPPTFRRPTTADRLAIVEVQDGTLRIEQAGRPPLIVSAIDGDLKQDANGWTLAAKTRDPEWGRWRVDGTIQADFSRGSLTISGLNVSASAERTACIPWVSPRVWDLVKLEGPMDVRESITFASEAARPVQAATWVHLRGTQVSLPRLSMNIEGVRGEIEVADRIVKIHHVNGFAMDGTLGADGTIDASRSETTSELDIRLDDISIAEAPKAWRLDSLEISEGRLSGSAKVRATASPERIDLAGSTGEAVVKQARVRGIPVRSLTIRMRGDGPDLRYESDPPPSEPPLPSAFSSKLMQAARLMSSLAAIRAGRPGARLVIPLASIGLHPTQPSTRGRRIEWPPVATGHIVLDHVAIEDLVDEATRAGVRLPFEATGLLSLDLDSTLPILDPALLREYHGTGTIAFHNAHLAGVALGEVQARVRLSGGVLVLSDFQPRSEPENPSGTVSRVAATEATTTR